MQPCASHVRASGMPDTRAFAAVVHIANIAEEMVPDINVDAPPRPRRSYRRPLALPLALNATPAPSSGCLIRQSLPCTVRRKPPGFGHRGSPQWLRFRRLHKWFSRQALRVASQEGGFFKDTAALLRQKPEPLQQERHREPLHNNGKSDHAEGYHDDFMTQGQCRR